MNDRAHALSLTATATTTGEATSGENICLKIDGQEFVASNLMLSLADDSKIVEATITFAIKKLEVNVSALVMTTDLETTTPVIKDINFTSPEVDVLQWQDIVNEVGGGTDFILVAEPNLPVVMQVFDNE